MRRSAGSSDPRGRLAILALALLAAVPLRAAAAPPAGGKTFLTREEALELAFPGCRIERATVYLTAQQRKRAEKLAGSKFPTGIAHPYTAHKEGKLVGTAWFDTHKVRTMKETVMVVVDPGGKVRRLEVLAFAEPLDYMPRGAWYAQFLGRGLEDGIDLKRGIRGITGATLTARATTDAVRRTLALQRVLAGPPPKP